MHRRRTDDFGGTAWMEPLEILTRSLDREARLTMAGRRRARSDLVAHLVGRTVEPDDGPAVRRPRVIITGSHPEAVATVEAALGSPPGRGTALLESSFVSPTFELRWHVPAFAEWLLDADLDAQFADIAARSSRRTDAAAVEVIGIVGLQGHIGRLAAALAGAIVVVVDTDPDLATAEMTRRCVLARSRDSKAVDGVRVERYWRWRIGLGEERRRAETPLPGSITLEHDAVLDDPATAAATVLAAAGPGQA